MLPIGVCILPENQRTGIRVGSYPHYIHEILGHAGLAYSDLPFDEIEQSLQALRVLVTVGEHELQPELIDSLRDWVRAGGCWLSLGGLCSAGELFGAEYAKAGHINPMWGYKGAATLGEGYLRAAPDETAAGHALLDHLVIPLHYFNGIHIQAERTSGPGPTVLAELLNAHGHETGRAGILENRVGLGRCMLIAIDVTGTVVRIQQGVAVTRDGVPSDDGTAPITDATLKCDDGAVLDWYFDRQDIPGVPGLKGFLQPVADHWRELVLRAIFHLAEAAAAPLCALWYYPRNMTALAHMSHDSDGNSPEKADHLLSLLEQCGIHSTWCVIAPGYDKARISAIRDAGHELAMHFDALADERWTKESFHQQWETLRALFGAGPVTNKNHYLRWQGDTEFFDWCHEHDIQLEQSKGGSKPGGFGYSFGTCHPYFPINPAGTAIDVLELAILSSDAPVFVPAEALPSLVNSALLNHGIMHILFHPGHTQKPEVDAAFRGIAKTAREAGLEWWTARRINEWERARRRASWQSEAAAPDKGTTLSLRAEVPLQGGTLLFRGAHHIEINGEVATSTSVVRWGLEFQAVTLDIEAGAINVRLAQ